MKKFWELPKNSFTINGEDYHVPCTFFIWEKSEGVDLRINPDDYKTNDFEIVKKEDADFFILGASPNTVKQINEVKATNRGYYIKAKNKSKSELIQIFKNLDFKGLSSANGGVSWYDTVTLLKQYIEGVKY